MSRASIISVRGTPRLPRGPRVSCALSAAALVLMTSPGLAADRSWGNSGGGTFSTSTNWINGLLAGVNDVAIFNRSRGTSQTAYTVSFSANAQNQSVFVGPDEVTFALGGRTYTTTAITGNEIGTAAAFSSRLTVQNGVFNMTGALTPQMLVGGAPGRVGSLILTNNATLTGAPNLLVGTASATGFVTLNGLSGGTATTSLLDVGSGAGGRGSVAVNGPFAALTSSRLLVGDAGSGTLSMSLAATLTNNGTATIGNLAGSAGMVTVDSTARWLQQNGTLIIGSSGAGTVNVLGAGSLLGQVAVLGASTGGSGQLSIDGSGSEASFSNMTIGELGVGSVTVSNGGALSRRIIGQFTHTVGNNGAGFVHISTGSRWGGAVATTLANGTNSTGQVTVSGPGASWDPGNLTIGVRGSGVLNIAGGAGVTSFDTATLGVNSTATGTVTVDGAGSSWRNFGTLLIGRSGPATLRITNGGRVTNEDQARVGGPGSSALVQGLDSQWITGDLTINGSGGFEGQLTIDAGGAVQSSRGGVPDPVGGGQASVTVSGANSRWSISNDLSVGYNIFSPTSAPGSLTISSGGLVEANSLRVGNNGTAILNGGTLRIGFLSFEDTPTFNFNSGTLRITGNPTLSASFLDKLLGPGHTITVGRILEIGGTPTLTSPLVLNGGVLSVPTLAAGSPLQFESGSFNLTSANLTIGSGGLLGSTVTLDNRNINVTNSTTIEPGGQLIFQGGSFFSDGGITNNGEIAVEGVTANIQNAIANNGGLRVAAGATANFFANVLGAGSFSGGGSKVFKSGSNSAAGNLDTSGSTTVDSGATLIIGRIREPSLSVSGIVRISPGGTDTSTCRLNSLQISVTGQLDLANNALVLDYTGASPINDIRALLTSGFAGGSWNGAGINSSIAASTPNRALGFAEATDIGSPATFAGQPIDSTSILVRFTLPGDADLTGTVNLDDFTRLAANFGLASAWSGGDFNFDAITNLDDFTALAANFGFTLPAPTAIRGGGDAAVPEPAMIGLALLPAMLRRRRVKPC